MPTPTYITTEAGDRIITETTLDALVGERSLPPYEGFNVFDLPANWAETPRERVRRNMAVLDSVTGRVTTRSHTTTPVPGFRISVALEGRTAINEFRSWLRSLRGRQIPVWVPTWMRDLEATADLTGSSISVESVGYEGWLFPHNARKHLAVIYHDREIYPVGVTSASDNGTTEVLGIAPSLAGPFTAEHTMISFLVLARLVDDSVDIKYFTSAYAEAQMDFVEVPREAPAP